MNTFLSKLGKVLATIVNVAGIAAGVGPILNGFLGSKASAVVGTVTNDLTAIGQVVVTAEVMFQAPGSGAAKLAAATPLVAQIIQTSEMVAGHHIQNEALFIQGCEKVTSGVADIENSQHPDGVPNPGPTVVAQPLPTLPPVSVPPVSVPPPTF